MAETLRPETPKQVLDVVRWAVAKEAPLEIVSGGSKVRVGGQVSAEHRLDLSAMSGVDLYEPEELVLRLGPGTPLKEVERILGEQGQSLPFEPPNLNALLGTEAEATIGGIVGTNLAGPRRFKAGAVRDYVIGIRCVSGFGETFKSGGRVVKNVSGYDLSKLMTGSFGTLAVLTQITLKVLPRPENSTTVLFGGQTFQEAVNTMRDVASGPFEASGLCHLPEYEEGVSVGSRGGVTAVRLEGPAVSLAERAEKVAAIAKAESHRLDEDASERFWREVRDASALLPPNGGTVWRVHIPPASAPAAIASNKPDHWYADWAGGLVWMHFDWPKVPELDVGNAMLIRAAEDIRAQFPPITPIDVGVSALSRRLKASFDPKGILNPGRMSEG